MGLTTEEMRKAYMAFINTLCFPILLTFLCFVILALVIEAFADIKVSGFQSALVLLQVASAGFSIGGCLGFLYAPYDDDDYKLGDLAKFLPIGAGGLVTADIFRPDPALVRLLQNLSTTFGSEQSEGLILITFLVFAPLGFLNLFVYRRLFLNSIIRHSDEVLVEDARKGLDSTMASLFTQVDAEATLYTDEKVQFDPTLKQSAEFLIKKWDKLRNKTPDDYIAYAKAHCVIDQPDKGVEILNQALGQFGDDATLKFNKALMLLLSSNKDYQGVIELLLSVCRSPSARTLGWKLLGYAYLMRDPQDVEASLHFSNAYKQCKEVIASSDPGVEFNLAVAYAIAGDRSNMLLNLDLCKRHLNLNPRMSRFRFEDVLKRMLDTHFKNFRTDTELHQKYALGSPPS